MRLISLIGLKQVRKSGKTTTRNKHSRGCPCRKSLKAVWPTFKPRSFFRTGPHGVVTMERHPSIVHRADKLCRQKSQTGSPGSMGTHSCVLCIVIYPCCVIFKHLEIRWLHVQIIISDFSWSIRGIGRQGFFSTWQWVTSWVGASLFGWGWGSYFPTVPSQPPACISITCHAPWRCRRCPCSVIKRFSPLAAY